MWPHDKGSAGEQMERLAGGQPGGGEDLHRQTGKVGAHLCARKRLCALLVAFGGVCGTCTRASSCAGDVQCEGAGAMCGG